MIWIGSQSFDQQDIRELIPGSKVVDNHHLIDPVAMVFERRMPEYQPLRKLVVNVPAIIHPDRLMYANM